MRSQSEIDNASFSNKAHFAARRQIYPKIFNVSESQLAFEKIVFENSVRDRILDAELGIDCLVRVKVKLFKYPLIFAVQERFRREKYAKYRDITLTEYDLISGLPCEFYNLIAGLFVYGYFNDVQNNFSEVICVSVPSMFFSIISGDLEVQRKVKNNDVRPQSFITISFESLEQTGLVLFRQSSIREKEAVEIFI